jgi:uncharacterized secreted repeat protein (TIGR03808 family)
MLNRRQMMAGLAAAGGAAVAGPCHAQAGGGTGFRALGLRGAVDATTVGMRAGALDDQSRTFSALLAKAAASRTPVDLPAGSYRISNIVLPQHTVIRGVPGATRLVYGGDGFLLMADHAEQVDLSGIVLDGGNRRLAEDIQGLCDLRGVERVAIDDCQITGSAANGVAMERCSGRVERSTISGAAQSGLYSVEAGRMTISGNAVLDCANGGILVHRWQAGEDLTLVTGNRVERIAARNGGTGPFGNGINLFRANGAVVSGNVVTDCAFSAIRANSASAAQISGNTCLRSGETAIYAEFAFEGAVVSGNIVDGAANGISIVNFDQGGRLATCQGNVVRNLSRVGPYPADAPGFGVGITVEADTAVTGNVVEEAPLYGLKIGWGPFMRNVTATGNVLRRCATGIAVSVVEGTGAALVADNVIDGAPDGGVVGFRWSERATEDLALSGSNRAGNVTVERNRVS